MTRLAGTVMVASMGLLVASLASAAPSERPRYRLDLEVDIPTRRVEGTTRIELRNPTGAPLHSLPLWLYPNALARPPRGLNDLNRFWIYPVESNPGGMELTAVKVDGIPVPPSSIEYPEGVDIAPAGPRTVALVALPRPIAPDGRFTLELTHRTTVPERFGPFGCVRQSCTLAGGFYPMVLAWGGRGWAWHDWPARGDFDVQLRRTSPRVSSFLGATQDVPYVTAVLTERPMRPSVQPQRTGTAPATRIVYIHPGPPLDGEPGGRPHNGASCLPSLPSVRVGERLFEDVAEALDLLADLRLERLLGGQLVLIEVPLRGRLAEVHPGLILVSDQLFRLFPAKRIQKFHSFQLVRAVFAERFERGHAHVESDGDLSWVPDAVASYLVELFTLHRFHQTEFARDILKGLSFVPAIDELIYAPQVSFASAYNGSIDDPDDIRDDLRRWNNDRPRGKLLYEKLKDLVGEKGWWTIVRRLLVDRRPLRLAAAEVFQELEGEPLDWFFAQWLHAAPKMNVRLGAVSSSLCGGGAGAVAYCHRIEVVRQGAPVREPVVVFVRDRAGATTSLRWEGRERSTVLTWQSGATLAVVHVDPALRLIEELPAGADNAQRDQRLDNRLPGRWRFLYNNLGALLNVTDLSSLLTADVSLRRAYDVDNDLRFTLFHSASVLVGGSFGYSRYLGRRVAPMRLSSAVAQRLTIARLDSTFGRAAGDRLGGTAISLSTGVGYDDRYTVFDPTHGLAFGASIRWTATVFDSLNERGARVEHTLSLGAEVTKVWPLGGGASLAAHIEGATRLGPATTPSQLLAVGGAGGLRAYGTRELFGRDVLLGRVELRHSFVRTMTLNVGHVFYGRGIGGAFFAEGAALSSCDSHGDLFAPRNLFSDVGYGLRLFYDNLGVSPALLLIDVAVPLARRSRRCLDTPDTLAAPGLPVGILISFKPPF